VSLAVRACFVVVFVFVCVCVCVCAGDAEQFVKGHYCRVIPPRRVETEERGVEELTITAMTITTAITTTDACK